MKKLLLALGGVMMISSPANAITWNEFWEPFQSETHVHVGGPRVPHTHRRPRRHNHCHRHYDFGYSHCHRHRPGHHQGSGHHYHGHGHRYDYHYYEGHSTEIIIR